MTRPLNEVGAGNAPRMTFGMTELMENNIAAYRDALEAASTYGQKYSLSEAARELIDHGFHAQYAKLVAKSLQTS